MGQVSGYVTGMRWIPSVCGRHKVYKAGKTGTGYLQGVEDINEGYETGTRGIRQLSKV